MFKLSDDTSFGWVVLRGEPPSTYTLKIWVAVKTDDATHTAKGYWKAYYLHNRVFWREQSRRPKQVQSVLRTQGKEAGWGYVLWTGAGPERGPHMLARAVCPSPPTRAEGESTWLSHPAHLWADGEGRRRGLWAVTCPLPKVESDSLQDLWPKTAKSKLTVPNPKHRERKRESSTDYLCRES